MAAEALVTTGRVKIINKKEFAVAVLNADDETFVVYIAILAKPAIMPIHTSCKAQVTMLISKKTGIPTKYSNFSNVFFSDSVVELPEYTRNNNHLINLLDNKQLSYSLIYSLGLVELKILETYIKTNLASNFIRPSKSLASIAILFVQKKNNSLCLCIDFQELSNLTIKNCYPLPLIGKLLDCLGCAKHFT